MIQHYGKRRKSDFGTLGGDDAEFDEGEEGYGQPVDVGELGGGGGQEQGSGGIMKGLMGSLASVGTGGMGGGLMSMASGMCGGCANKDKAAEKAKKDELAKKYPVRDCGPTPTQECLSYNEQMKARQDAEYSTWLDAKNKQVASQLTPDDKQRFAAVAQLASQLKALHPEAANMTLSQIYKQYPDDFDRIYTQLQGQYPFLKNIDAQTALAMSPGVASMTLDQLIAQTSSLSGGMGGAPSSSGASSAGLGIGIMAAAGAALLLLLKGRD